MLRKFQELIYKHIKGNIVIYFFVCLFFMIGISAGVFTVKALSDSQKQELISYMRSFFQVLQSNPVDEFSVFKQSLINNLQTGILIWLLGITIVGFPLILLLVAVRGLIIGFTVGFLIEQMNWRGILFSLCAVLPHNLLIIPSILVISVIGVSFSI
ncbi:MAG TPA: stage II sporulation protein M, partial [Clostridiales bacterium]|nr:stage II sporulation protein M [Clostridiales bacterium]